jgi:hypothetical protein
MRRSSIRCVVASFLNKSQGSIPHIRKLTKKAPILIAQGVLDANGKNELTITPWKQYDANSVVKGRTHLRLELGL